METHMNLHDTGPLKHTAEENSLDSFSSDFFYHFFYCVCNNFVLQIIFRENNDTFSFFSGPCTVVFYIRGFPLLLRMSSSLASTF